VLVKGTTQSSARSFITAKSEVKQHFFGILLSFFSTRAEIFKLSIADTTI
jgi:hypothetical protein